MLGFICQGMYIIRYTIHFLSVCYTQVRACIRYWCNTPILTLRDRVRRRLFLVHPHSSEPTCALFISDRTPYQDTACLKFKPRGRRFVDQATHDKVINFFLCF